MQVLIAFVLLFSLWTISSAADVTVYDGYEYVYSKPGHEPKPLAVSQFPWKFSYTMNDFVYIYLKNIPPGMTINVTAVTEYGTFMAKNVIIDYNPRRGEEYYDVYFNSQWKSTEIKMNLYKKSSNLLCASLLVAEGKDAATIPNEMKAQYYDIENWRIYALVVDLKHQCEDHPPSVTGTTMSTTTEKTVTRTAERNPNNTYITSNNNSSTDLEITTNKNSTIDIKNAEQPQELSMYILISVLVVLCAIQLVFCLIWKKICCPRKSTQVEAIEMNTVPHQPFYLNLLFRRECDQEIRQIEGHEYEEIRTRISDHTYEEIGPTISEGG